jgi:hypothetical protein
MSTLGHSPPAAFRVAMSLEDDYDERSTGFIIEAAGVGTAGCPGRLEVSA